MDTCVCIALIKQMPSVVEHIRKVGVSECKISDLTIGELYFGAFKSGREQHFEDVIEIYNLFEQYPTSYCMREYGDIRWQLERSGQRIDSIDLLIMVVVMHRSEMRTDATLLCWTMKGILTNMPELCSTMAWGSATASWNRMQE